MFLVHVADFGSICIRENVVQVAADRAALEVRGERRAIGALEQHIGFEVRL